jgi:hypothetical protein
MKLRHMIRSGSAAAFCLALANMNHLPINTAMVSPTFQPLHPAVFPFGADKAPFGPSIDSQRWVSEPTQGQPDSFVGSGGYQYNETVGGDVGEES